MSREALSGGGGGGGGGPYKWNKKIIQNKLITKHTLFHYQTKLEGPMRHLGTRGQVKTKLEAIILTVTVTIT